VQILVVVANIQVRNLKAEEGNGFKGTVLGLELVDPKAKRKRSLQDNFCRTELSRFCQKGIRLIFLNQ